MKTTLRQITSLSPRLFAGLGLIAVGAIVGTVTVALADGDYSTSGIGNDVASDDIIVPYDGYMMIDGAAMTGSQDMKFTLYQASSGGTPVWCETQTVDAYNGRFSVGLGAGSLCGGGSDPCASAGDTGACLSQVIKDAEQVYLAIAVKDGNTSSYVALSGRQKIEPVPYAAWSATSSDFQVNGDLTVDGQAQLTGSATVTGGLTADSVRTTGALDVVGSSTFGGQANFADPVVLQNPSPGDPFLRFDLGQDWVFRQAGSGAAADLWLQNTGTADRNFFVETDGALMIEGSSSSGSATLSGSGDAHFTGDLTVDGTSDLGLVMRVCSTGVDVTDCFCQPGEAAISGGTFGTDVNNHGLRESRPIIRNGLSGWRIACIDRDDGDFDNVWCGNSQGDTAITIICAPVSIADGGNTGIVVP